MVPAFSADVTMSGARWRAFQAPEVEELVPPGPHIADRTVVLAKSGDGLKLSASWAFNTDAPGWFRGVLADPELLVESLSWNGREIGLNEQRELVVWVDKPGVLRLVASMKARIAVGEGPLLHLLPAARGVVQVPLDWAIAADGMVHHDVGEWLGGAADLALVGKAKKERSGRALVRAQVAVGVTVGDAAAMVQAHAVWSAAQGGMDSVAFTVPGAGPDLAVTGPQLASFERSGDRVVVTLREANLPVANLHVTWSVAVPQGEAASIDAPRLLPENTFRSSFVTKLARDGDVEVVPEGAGWETRAFAELPPWSDGLVSGTSTAALSSSRGDGLRLQLLRFEPVSGPATIIDVASTSMAFSDEGRVILRTHLQVRNDRGAFLTVTPPPGMRFLGASVAGEIAEPFEDGRSWRIAMKKSVETVDGLLSFPVRLIMVGEREPFERRTRMSMALPTFDAEVAAHRVSVNLPMGSESKLPVGEKNVVDAFSEGDGITYGFAVGDARASEADALFQTAVQSWMANDFDAAQSTLTTLNNMGASSQDVSRLQGNLDLVFGNDEQSAATGVSASSRRVKEQAKARSIDEEREQERILQEAQKAELAGDYVSASSGYEQALGSGKKLARLDQAEDKGNAYKNAEFEKKLEELQRLQAVVEERDRRNEESAAAAANAARESAYKRAQNEAAYAQRDEEEARRGEAERAAAEAAASIAQKPGDPIQVTAREKAVDVSDTSRNTMLAKDVIAEEPAKVQVSDSLSGDTSPYNAYGDEAKLLLADKEAQYVLDGASVSDEVVATKSKDKGGQPAGGKPDVAYRERTEIDFDDMDIVGELVQPEGRLLLDRKTGNGPAPAAPPVVAAAPRPEPLPAAMPAPAPPPPPPPPPSLVLAPSESIIVATGEDGWGDGGVEGGLVLGEASREVTVDRSVVFADDEAPPEPSPELLTQEFLQKVPAGRTYQSSLQVTAGVSGGRGGHKKRDIVVDTRSTSSGTTLGRSGAVGGLGGKADMAGGATFENVYTESEEEEQELESIVVAQPDTAVFKKGAKGQRDGKPEKPKEKRFEGHNLKSPPAPKPPADSIDIAMGDSDELPDVKATTLDIIVPALGETVRYQHLLVPAGAESTVYIETRPQRGRRKP